MFEYIHSSFSERKRSPEYANKAWSSLNCSTGLRLSGLESFSSSNSSKHGWFTLVTTWNLVSDSNVSQHLGFFKENKKARITSGLSNLFFTKHFGEMEERREEKSHLFFLEAQLTWHFFFKLHEAEVIFFLSAFTSSAKILNKRRISDSPTNFHRAFLGCWKWSAGFESETFVERQKWSGGHETKNLRLVLSLLTTSRHKPFSTQQSCPGGEHLSSSQPKSMTEFPASQKKGIKRTPPLCSKAPPIPLCEHPLSE